MTIPLEVRSIGGDFARAAISQQLATKFNYLIGLMIGYSILPAAKENGAPDGAPL
jgi:uncharacterized metal-binding protein